MKTKIVMALAAALSLSLSGAAFAQEVVGSNGHVVDGMGGGGQYANKLVPDGNPSPTVTFIPNDTGAYLRRSNNACDLGLINGQVNDKCPPPSRQRQLETVLPY
jgi:hypothetical protein